MFVKFISWNILYIDFIMRAFPTVPAIFLYRDPTEIIASVRKSATAILEAKDRPEAELFSGLSRPEINQLDATSYLAWCYARSLQTAANWRDERLSLLEYPTLKAERFSEILMRSLRYAPTTQALNRMLPQFEVYSKDDGDKRAFAGDQEEKAQLLNSVEKRVVSGITLAVLDNLRRDERNLFSSGLTAESSPEGSGSPRALLEV